MTVTIGARGSRSSSLSSSSAMASCTSALTNSVLKPNSSATRSIVSASMRWLILTIMPMLMHVPITFVTGTSIMVASSLAVTNSVSLSTLLSALASSICSSCCARACSRFSLRYLAPFEAFVLLVRRASVSFTCFATSSSLTSGLMAACALRLRSFCRLLPPCALPPCALPPWLLPRRPLPPWGWLAAAFTSTFSLPMRLRLRFSPFCPLVPAA